MSITHEVFNQATPLADANLFQLNLPLQEALAWHHPEFDRARFEALGAEMGSAEMQVHARLANLHSPVLHAHDRFGHRIDQVEFHPSYHALMQQRAAPPAACHAVDRRRGRAHRACRGLHALHRTGALDPVPGVDELRGDAGAARAAGAVQGLAAQAGQHAATTRASCPSRRRRP